MPTFIPHLGTPDKHGTSMVYVKVTTKYERVRMPVGVRVRPADWNAKKKEVRVSNPEYSKINAAIRRKISDLEAIYNAKLSGGVKVSAKELQRTAGAGSFFTYAYEYLEGKTYNTKRSRVAIVNKFRSWAGRDLSFAEITPEMIERYVGYLKGFNKQYTVHVNIKRLKEVFTSAVRVGLFASNPFDRVQVDQGKANRAKLTADEVRMVEAAELPERLKLARDAWLFSFYCAGMRFGDVCCLNPEKVKGDRLIYTMNKTGAVREVKLHPKAAALLPKVMGMIEVTNEATELRKRIAAKNVVINRQLKEVAKLAGVDKLLTFHVSRHTFADIARKKKLPIQVTSELLGHSSIAVTQAYFGRGFDDDTLDAALDEVIG